MCGVESEASDGGGGTVVHYYTKVMRLLEQFPAPSYVIKIAESATRMIDKDDPGVVSHFSTASAHLSK